MTSFAHLSLSSLGWPALVVVALGWLCLACVYPRLAHTLVLIPLAWLRSPESVIVLDDALARRETPR